MKRIDLGSGKDYLKAMNALESNFIEIDKTARYNPQENGRAEWMNRTLKNSIMAMFINTGTPGNYWDK